MGINLQDSILIVDEAHNLRDAICDMYSVTLTVSTVSINNGIHFAILIVVTDVCCTQTNFSL